MQRLMTVLVLAVTLRARASASLVRGQTPATETTAGSRDGVGRFRLQES